MSLITKLSVLNTSKFPNQVLKTCTTTHKSQVPLISRVGCKNSHIRSRSLPCRPVNSFGLIQLLQRSVSPNPYLIRRAEISYISNKLSLIKEWQKRSAKRLKTTLEDRLAARTLLKKNSQTDVPNPTLSKLKDAIKNVFCRKSETTELPVDNLEDPIPNMKMKIVPYNPGRANSGVELTPVDLEEQERLTPKVTYPEMDVNVRPITYCEGADDECKSAALIPQKKLKNPKLACKSNFVEVICADVDNDAAEVKRKKYVPFQNINETVTEPKASPRSGSAVISIADMCKAIDNDARSRSRGKGNRYVVSYPVKKKGKCRSSSRNSPKHVVMGKANSLDESEPKTKKSNYWAEPKSRGQSGLSNNQSKVEPCDPYKDSKRKLSNVSCNDPNANLTKLSYKNYSIPCEAEANMAENDIFTWYENSDNVTMENLGELRKNQSNLKVTKPINILSQKKALATSHVDILNTQLLCSNLFCSSASKQFSENLQPFHIKSYLTQPNYDLTDLGVLNLIVAHDKEIRKVEWEKQKSNIYDLKTKAKVCKPKPKLIEDTEVYEQVSEIDQHEHESKSLTKPEEEVHEDQEEEPKTKATTKKNDEKNSSTKPITFIKKEYHTLSSRECFASRKLEAQEGLVAYSTNAKKGGGRKKAVYIANKGSDKSDPSKIDDVIKRAQLKQGKSLMKHTEWKAVAIKGMRSPAEERKRLREEREKYKELIRIRSNSREKKRLERCILHTPFDKVEEPKRKERKECVEDGGDNKNKTDDIFSTNSNNIDDCGCVAANTRKPPAWSNEIMDPRKNLQCVQKECVPTTDDCQEKLRIILIEMKEQAAKLKKLEKLMRKNKNYNSNCDTVRSRNMGK